MQHRALIVDDDASIRRIVRSVLDSLGHKYAEASSQESARKILAGGGFTYVLLDLEIPEKDLRGIPRIQNGMNFLEEVSSEPATAAIPVIVMTAHAANNNRLIMDCIDTGASNYIDKPFPITQRTLDSVIKHTLRKRPGRLAPVIAQKGKPKQFEGGILAFFSDRVELCGVRIAGGENSTHIRKILDLLRKKNSAGRYVAFSGEELADEIGAESQNSISGTITEFREKVCNLLLKELSIECGEYGLIENAGGYRYAANIDVCGNEQSPEHTQAPAIAVPSSKQLDKPERQAWIFEQCKNGVRLRLADIMKALRCSDRTAIRDTGDLKKKGLIQYHGDAKSGYYSLSQ